MTNRKPLSKKTRFEVFKRDSFTCQYCGDHPPSAILECDHIHPVSAGGGNEIDNLVTACFCCNRGKSDRKLSDVPQSLQDKAKQVIEREAQINGYQSAVNAKKRRIDDEADQVCDLYERFQIGYTLSERNMVTVRMFVEKLGVHEVCHAMEIANTKVRRGEEFRYFCGVCWRKIKEAEK